MDDLHRWLDGIGLGQLRGVFAEHAIDLEVLPELTDGDLQQLGLPLGARRKLLKAIRELGCELAREPVPLPSAPAAAQRRQLTLLFCDLVGSTALSAGLDPEDWAPVLRGYHAICDHAVTRFEGSVAQFLGDGVLARFGYPVAHEDDAERAVRCGLELLDAIAVAELRPGLRLAARAGIATGFVVVGARADDGSSLAVGVGDTPNLAGRLQAIAAPSQLVIAESTQRLIGSAFECADLGLLALKGFPAPVRAFRVVAERAAASRFDARHSAALSPIVGRAEEIGLVLRRWRQAIAGEGQVVLLSGEAGIGKSRVLAAVQEPIARQAHVPIRWQCSPYHLTTPLFPVVNQLTLAARITADDPPAIKRAKLAAMLAASGAPPADAPELLAALLGIPPDPDRPEPAHDPRQRKRLTLHALAEQLAALARRQPVLFLVEDAHWMDPTTRELTDLLLGRIERLAVLALITHRPEFAAPWSARPHATAITLNRLDRRQGAELIGRVAGGRALPDPVLNDILTKTDGVPLFVEELTKTVLESGLLAERGGRLELTGPLLGLAIPATLRDSLLARLDRLGPVREIAQTAAAIGREFGHELLAAVTRLDDAALVDALDQLGAAELVSPRGTFPAATYMFKHALVRDAAYDSLLRGERQALHARIAAAIEARLPNIPEATPEELAHHLTEAGATEAAIVAWEHAAQRSIARFANEEALGQVAKALQLLDALPESPARDATELRLRLAQGIPALALRGYAGAEVAQAYGRAKLLSERLDETANRFAAVRGVWNNALMCDHTSRTLALAHELGDLAERCGGEPEQAAAARALGFSLFTRGRLLEALEQLERGIEIGSRADTGFAPYGEHPALVCRLYSGWVLLLLGRAQSAFARFHEALDQARRLGNPHFVAFALSVGSVGFGLGRAIEVAHGWADEGARVSTEHRFSQWLAHSTFVRGWCRIREGDLAGGTPELVSGIAAWRATGARLMSTWQQSMLVERHLAAGDLTAARTELAAGLAHVERFEELWLEAELHRLDGALLRAEGAPDDACEAAFERARAVARGQAARSWELRTALSLAGLWDSQGRRAAARALVGDALAALPQRADLPDQRDAERRLDTP
jgi:class 3 adenylate cyclase/predicted ATPase